tara:strand:+ start:1205 stop:1390 length:186 start_codon:yes stop_codon:yes gene_type:complete
MLFIRSEENLKKGYKRQKGIYKTMNKKFNLIVSSGTKNIIGNIAEKKDLMEKDIPDVSIVA